ncbi:MULTISPECIES: DUF3267 domain-containing protein [Lysinibacillus]|uniref:DUF3267 domain-containing protein n=1 Tax=Lysinibacillus antri TaxID=2498145 RepID=A0A3S0RHT3_9BACI|nr:MULTISPECIES: DUF3267 domain-containing protein [Lysinibacillus]RUL49452.1 DUF3267 domain-containing protein [Lysinibacillus antri]TSI11109.1 DUF3267 domain-containing protein [Lysinibacillus sp. BW-2-10]
MTDGRKPIIVELDMRRIAKSNLWLTLILCIVFVFFNSLLHQRYSVSFSFWDVLLFILGYILLIALHEIFHLIGFMLFGRVKFKDLEYGVNLKLGVAYATTTTALNNAAMKKALLLPFWTTGVIPTLLGFIYDSHLIVLLGAMLIAGAIGDFYMYKELRKYPNSALIKDDPELPRLYIYD